MIRQISFVPLELSLETEAQYNLLVKSSMDPSDHLEYEELSKKTRSGEYESWWAVVGHEKVGWTGAVRNSRYFPGAIHLYGSCIFPEFRGKGYARTLTTYRMKRYDRLPLTVSVQPSNFVSLHVFHKLGFRGIGHFPPWLTLFHDNRSNSSERPAIKRT